MYIFSLFLHIKLLITISYDRMGVLVVSSSLCSDSRGDKGRLRLRKREKSVLVIRLKTL